MVSTRTPVGLDRRARRPSAAARHARADRAAPLQVRLGGRVRFAQGEGYLQVDGPTGALVLVDEAIAPDDLDSQRSRGAAAPGGGARRRKGRGGLRRSVARAQRDKHRYGGVPEDHRGELSMSIRGRAPGRDRGAHRAGLRLSPPTSSTRRVVGRDSAQGRRGSLQGAASGRAETVETESDSEGQNGQGAPEVQLRRADLDHLGPAQGRRRGGCAGWVDAGGPGREHAPGATYGLDVGPRPRCSGCSCAAPSRARSGDFLLGGAAEGPPRSRPRRADPGLGAAARQRGRARRPPP